MAEKLRRQTLRWSRKRKAMLLKSRYHICTWHEVVSYLFGTAHLFKTSRSKKRRLKKCNQKCLGCRDSKPAFIFSCTNRGFLPPHRRQGGHHSANATRRPCFVKITIILSHVWKHDVCGELLPVSPVKSWLVKKKSQLFERASRLATQENRPEICGTMRRFFETTSEHLSKDWLRMHIEKLHILESGTIFFKTAQIHIYTQYKTVYKT